MKTLNERIEHEIKNYLSEQDRMDVSNFDDLYSTMDESHKSHIIKILLGHGLIKKGTDGKLSKADPEKVKQALTKIGIKS